MTLEERLDRLERQNRWLKTSLLGIGAMVILAIVAGANAQKKRDPIQTTKLELVDDDGKVRARLTAYALDFINEKDESKPLAEFAPGQMFFHDEKGKQRVLLSLGRADGKTVSSALTLDGPGGRSSISSTDNTGPMVDIFTRAEASGTFKQNVARMQVVKGVPSFFLARPSPDLPILHAELNASDEGPNLLLYAADKDKKEVRVKASVVGKDGSIEILNKDGTAVFHAGKSR